MNIAEIKKLHWDLTKRLKEQKEKETEFKLFSVEKKILNWQHTNEDKEQEIEQ